MTRNRRNKLKYTRNKEMKQEDGDKQEKQEVSKRYTRERKENGT